MFSKSHKIRRPCWHPLASFSCLASPASSVRLRANLEQFELNMETPLHRAGNGKGPTSTWPSWAGTRDITRTSEQHWIMPAQQRAPQADQNVGVPSADTQHLRQVCQSSKRYPVLNPQIIRDRVGWLPRRHDKRTTVAFSRVCHRLACNRTKTCTARYVSPAAQPLLRCCLFSAGATNRQTVASLTVSRWFSSLLHSLG